VPSVSKVIGADATMVFALAGATGLAGDGSLAGADAGVSAAKAGVPAASVKTRIVHRVRAHVRAVVARFIVERAMRDITPGTVKLRGDGFQRAWDSVNQIVRNNPVRHGEGLARA